MRSEHAAPSGVIASGPRLEAAAPSFLATTALEEFWRTDRKMLFLSEACRRFDRRAAWEPLDAEVMEHVWRDRERLAEAQRRLPALGEQCLDRLVPWLNRIHGENRSRRYWQVVVGPFVFFHTYACYFRHTALAAAFSRFPSLGTLGIHASDYRTPADTQEFVEAACNSDRFNLQLYTQIIDEIRPGAIQYVSLPPDVENAADVLARGKDPPLRRLARKALAALNRRLFNATPVTMYLGTASWGARIRLAVGSAGDLWPVFDDGRRAGGSGPVDRHLRAGLPWQEESEPLLRLVLKGLTVNLPWQFVEGYGGLVQAAADRFRRRPRCIVSDSGWYFDEPFKVWAARQAEGGVKLVTVQHGGTYGDARYCPHENHEKAIADVFISWGWQDGPTVAPLPSLRLAAHRRARRAGRRRLLWTSTALPRYADPSDPMPATYLDYLAMQFAFVGGLEAPVRADLLLRLYIYDYGWSARDRWSQRFPDLALQEARGAPPFARVLAGSRLFIGDNPGTTFLEALACNTPTLLFWPDEADTHRDASHSFYDSLRRAGIFHDSPESAARQLNAIYPRIEAWWQEPLRQQARSEFCSHFARSSPDWPRRWTTCLRGIAR